MNKDELKAFVTGMATGGIVVTGGQAAHSTELKTLYSDASYTIKYAYIAGQLYIYFKPNKSMMTIGSAYITLCTGVFADDITSDFNVHLDLYSYKNYRYRNFVELIYDAETGSLYACSVNDSVISTYVKNSFWAAALTYDVSKLIKIVDDDTLFFAMEEAVESSAVYTFVFKARQRFVMSTSGWGWHEYGGAIELSDEFEALQSQHIKVGNEYELYRFKCVDEGKGVKLYFLPQALGRNNESPVTGIPFIFTVPIKSETLYPPKYQTVDYLQSNGDFYMDTGVVPTSNTRVVLDIMPLVATGDYLFGNCQSETSNCWRFFNASNYIYFDLDGRLNGNSLRPNERATIELGNYYVNKNGERVLTGDARIKQSMSLTLYMFGGNVANRGGIMAAQRLYSAKIYEGDTLIRDYVPMLRVQDDYIEPCMYDKVNNDPVFAHNDATPSYG